MSEEYLEYDTVETARQLLGRHLYRESDEGLVSGIIVETEAYLSENDPACHAFRGRTKRNAVMFGPPGRAYIYFIYGNHHCFNVVTGLEGKGEAVLIRAVEPVKGLDLMFKRRGKCRSLKDLASGPGKLCQAFAIDKTLDGHDLNCKPLYIKEDPAAGVVGDIACTPRIGVSSAKDKCLRFIIKGNNYLSR